MKDWISLEEYKKESKKSVAFKFWYYIYGIPMWFTKMRILLSLWIKNKRGE